MAVTGSGTSADPWVVHSYSEIKSTIESMSDGKKYMVLGNDIDCNS